VREPFAKIMEVRRMVKMKRMVSSSGRSGTLMDASLALDDVELLPEEAAFLKMIHSTNLE